MTTALRAAAAAAHPDPKHIIHKHLTAISSHSLRVYACLCLRQAGWDEDAIAHQLRWNSTAVKYYIRQSILHVDQLSATLFANAVSN